ncbi:thiopeptide-type bacteriocin biosynthesis protein [Sphaerisporangium sp. NPDC051017]|uniref:thiopeptide-type bacteriocin biosynthesis protein n=1 Tax=Sphaerisporangium sp. NPDC051017 TaxID=3154636 RepID=UPI00341BA9D6
MQPSRWRQTNAAFTDRRNAEHTFITRIGPALIDAEDHGLLTAWFFLRKQQWRFRWLPTSPEAADTIIRMLTDADRSVTWTSVVCEFEPLAFGGPSGLSAACEFFHADSQHLLRRLATDRPLGQRETSVLLCSALLRGAGLDWFEQGDVWSRVIDLRATHQPAIPADTGKARDLHDATRTLLTADAHGLCDLAQDGPLSCHQEWITAFEQTGRTLARLNDTGQLERGLRAVLAHHLIFHFNRAGLTGIDQATLAALAINVIFHERRQMFTTTGAPADDAEWSGPAHDMVAWDDAPHRRAAWRSVPNPLLLILRRLLGAVPPAPPS